MMDGIINLSHTICKNKIVLTIKNSKNTDKIVNVNNITYTVKKLAWVLKNVMGPYSFNMIHKNNSIIFEQNVENGAYNFIICPNESFNATCVATSTNYVFVNNQYINFN